MERAIRYTHRGFSAFERTGRLQRKIDVYAVYSDPVGKSYNVYSHSTNWHARCCDAVAAANREIPGQRFRAFFARR